MKRSAAGRQATQLKGLKTLNQLIEGKRARNFRRRLRPIWTIAGQSILKPLAASSRSPFSGPRLHRSQRLTERIHFLSENGPSTPFGSDLLANWSSSLSSFLSL